MAKPTFYLLSILCSLQLLAQLPAPAVDLTPANPTVSVVQAEKSPLDLHLPSRRGDELTHLTDVIHYYRSMLAPIQTVGQPSDAQYRDEAIVDGKQVAEFAFRSGHAEAAFEAIYETGGADQEAAGGEEQRLHAAKAQVADRLAKLSARWSSLQIQFAGSKHEQLKLLKEQINQVEGAMKLDAAMDDALAKVLANSVLLGHSGLAGDIDRLQRATPELIDGKTVPVALPLDSLSGVASAGLTSQASALFKLLSARDAIDDLIEETKTIQQQAINLQAPLSAVVQKVTKVDASSPGKNEGISQSSDFDSISTKESFEAKAATLQAIGALAVPMTQEILVLEQSRANLIAWRAAVAAEYRAAVRSLLLRAIVIAVMLVLLFILGETWKRLTVRWVHDARRRRQLMGPRRIVIGCLSALVLFFGCVTQFHSLATFAGFIVAGLAVGLQTILLSVAAYFFIIGRYGVHVGDRMTISGVTGDVVEVDLLRFYMLELAGYGGVLEPTGRVAVFNNAVLFQAGTPLYKQMPGAAYTWHEMTLSLLRTGAYEEASKTILETVRSIYEPYRESVERQHTGVMAWADARAVTPKVESRLQFVEGGLQLLVRFPVELYDTIAIDEKVTQAMLRLMQEDEGVKTSVSGPPTIRSTVRV